MSIRNMKRGRGVACVFLTGALLIFAAACGGESSGGSQGSSGDGAQRETTSETPAAEALLRGAGLAGRAVGRVGARPTV